MGHDGQMLTRFLIALAALLLPAQVLAQDLRGHWALRIDEATIFVFTLEQQESGEWVGAWTRPEAIDSNGVVFRNMSGQQTVRPSQTRQRGEVVQLTFAGPEGTRRNDVLHFALVGENQAQLDYQGIPGDPYPLIRVSADTPLGPFDPVRIYDRDNAIVAAEFGEEDDEAQQLADAGSEPDEQPAAEDAINAAPALADSDAADTDFEVDWQPQGLVDEDAAAAAAALAGLELESVGEADSAEADLAQADDEEDERARITADFLDGL